MALVECPACHKQISKAAAACPSCGEPMKGAAKKSNPILVGCGGLMMLFVIFAGINGVMESCSSNPVNVNRAAVNAAPVAQASSATHPMGQPFSIGYLSYTVHKAQWSSAPLAGQAPNAAFVAVEVSVTNGDRSASMVPPFHLIDEAGAEYDESGTKIFLPGAIGLLENLNPGVSKRGWLLFDAPQAHAYKLKVSGGYTSGDAALVPLQ